jgi:hypothetical protein
MMAVRQWVQAPRWLTAMAIDLGDGSELEALLRWLNPDAHLLRHGTGYGFPLS